MPCFLHLTCTVRIIQWTNTKRQAWRCRILMLQEMQDLSPKRGQRSLDSRTWARGPWAHAQCQAQVCKVAHCDVEYTELSGILWMQVRSRILAKIAALLLDESSTLSWIASSVKYPSAREYWFVRSHNGSPFRLRSSDTRNRLLYGRGERVYQSRNSKFKVHLLYNGPEGLSRQGCCSQ